MTETVVMSKGEVIIPQNIRRFLGVSPGDRVKFVVEKGAVRVYAAKQIQKDNDKEQKKPSKKMAAFNRLMELREEIAAANLPPIDEIRREAIEEKYGSMLSLKRD